MLIKGLLVYVITIDKLIFNLLIIFQPSVYHYPIFVQIIFVRANRFYIKIKENFRIYFMIDQF